MVMPPWMKFYVTQVDDEYIDNRDYDDNTVDNHDRDNDINIRAFNTRNMHLYIYRERERESKTKT